MGDTEDKAQANAPAWQQAQEKAAVAEAQTTDAANSQPATLEQARKFLQDPEVQKATPERKAEFLASKGISPSDIEELLKDQTPQPATLEAAAQSVRHPVHSNLLRANRTLD